MDAETDYGSTKKQTDSNKGHYTQLNENKGTNGGGEKAKSALEIEDNHSSIIYNPYTNNTKRKKTSIAIQEFFIQSKATILSTGINICNANIGAGVLSLPFAVSDSGWFMGILLFILFGFMSTFSFNLLMSIGNIYYFNNQISSYAIVCNDILPILQIFIDIFIAFGYTLTCTGYLIIIGDYMPLVAKESLVHTC